MRKHFLLFILVAICHSSLAQYGYKCGSKFINLKPMDSPIRLVKLEDNSILDGIKDQQGKSRCISKIAKNYFLIDSTSKKLIKPIYESDVYKSKHGYNTIVLPEIVVSVVNADDIFVFIAVR